MRIFILLLILFGCSKGVHNSSNHLLSLEEFEQKISEENDVIILDVRTPSESRNGFIKGAQFMDFLDEGFEQYLDALDKEMQYVVYCQRGSRSGKAVEIMKTKGFKNVFDLDGGFHEWSAK